MASAKNSRIFITGGASGLGRALALRYARAGYTVCIADLNDERGESTRQELVALGSAAIYRHVDVTRESDLQTVADELVSLWGGVDIVINNAGVANAGAIEDVSIADWEWIIDINLLGVVRGCKVFTPIMKRQGSGHLVNIASMAGLLDVPRMAAYNVTKAAVVSLSETLDQELCNDGIKVSVVCPSFFQTNLGETLRTSDPGMRKMMNTLLSRGKLTADEVADTVFRSVADGKVHILPHVAGERLWLSKRYLPRTIYSKMFQRSLGRMNSAKKR